MQAYQKIPHREIIFIEEGLLKTNKQDTIKFIISKCCEDSDYRGG